MVVDGGPMVVRRWCAALGPKGQPCRAAPLKDSQFCRMHSPEMSKEVQEARRLGGLRRRHESAVSKAYLLESFTSVPGIRRLIEIAATDTLALNNTIPRNRALAYFAQIATHMHEVGELEERLVSVEKTVQEQEKRPGGER